MRVTNGQLEELLSRGQIMDKPLTAKTAYWIARIIDKCKSEARVYLKQKDALIEKHGARHESDGEESRAGKIIRRWKAGDLIREGEGIRLANPAAYLEELAALQGIEIDVQIERVFIDFEKEPNLTAGEILPFLPFIEEKV